MFDDKRAKDYLHQEKRQRKVTPFTVTDIGGKAELELWKLEQARKQAAWDAAAPARYAAAKHKSLGIISGERKATENKLADAAGKEYSRMQAVEKVLIKANKPTIQKDTRKWYTKAFDYVKELFLKVKFEA